MRRALKNWSGPAIIATLGGSLALMQFAHITAEGESLRAFVFGVFFPLSVSVGMILGDIWLIRSTFNAVATRRVAVWCLIGVVVLSLSAVFTILYQRSHGVYMAHQGFVFLNSASFGALIGFVIGLYDAQRLHQRQVIQARERALEDLHTTTRELVQTSDWQTIATQAVDAARDILDLPVNAIWLYNDSEDVLKPVATTDEGADLIEDLPTYTGEESLSWDAFETGEVMVFDDVREASNRHRTDTPIRSEIVLPLGDYGVMNIGSTEANAFDEVDVSMGRILAANTQAALRRADREQELAAARDHAKHLNRQLTVLNRVFRHDLRNSANVIHGHAELLTENTENDVSNDSAETICEQATDLVKMGEQVRDMEHLLQNDGNKRQRVDLVDIITTQLERIQRDYPEAETDGPSCETCPIYAHPLIESAVLNVIDNAIEHNDTPEPYVDVTITHENDYVTVQIADNGPGIPDTEVAVLERGYETPLEHTSGLGLWLVNWIIRESEGTVSFTEGKERGSVVRLRLEKANAGQASSET